MHSVWLRTLTPCRGRGACHNGREPPGSSAISSYDPCPFAGHKSEGLQETIASLQLELNHLHGQHNALQTRYECARAERDTLERRVADLSEIQQATDTMLATISELQQKIKDDAVKLTRAQHVKEQLAAARQRAAVLEPVLVELDEAREEGREARATLAGMQARLEQVSTGHSEELAGLRGQLGVARQNARVAQVRGWASCALAPG
jgi:FtsZ-binding cell division protein ZapB